MHNYIYYPIAFIISISIVILTTPIVKEIGLKTGRVDRPGGRKIHQRPMVRLGGIAIFFSTFVSLLAMWMLAEFCSLSSSQAYQILGLAFGSLMFFAIGLADDLLNLSPFSRLIMQTIVASIVWMMGIQIQSFSLPFISAIDFGILSLPITVIWLVGVVNAVNWIDGMDGLAAGVSGITACTMAIACFYLNQPAVGLIALALAGSTLGFLRYNFNPAQIFMGDGGAYFIGFILAGISVIALENVRTANAIVLAYLLLAVPLTDMVVVIIARLWNGKSPFSGDQRHLHHKLLRLGLSQSSAAWLVLCSNFVVG